MRNSLVGFFFFGMHQVMHTYLINSTRPFLGIQKRAEGRFEDLFLRRRKLLLANERIHFCE